MLLRTIWQTRRSATRSSPPAAGAGTWRGSRRRRDAPRASRAPYARARPRAGPPPSGPPSAPKLNLTSCSTSGALVQLAPRGRPATRDHDDFASPPPGAASPSVRRTPCRCPQDFPTSAGLLGVRRTPRRPQDSPASAGLPGVRRTPGHPQGSLASAGLPGVRRAPWRPQDSLASAGLPAGPRRCPQDSPVSAGFLVSAAAKPALASPPSRRERPR